MGCIYLETSCTIVEHAQSAGAVEYTDGTLAEA